MRPEATLLCGCEAWKLNRQTRRKEDQHLPKQMSETYFKNRVARESDEPGSIAADRYMERLNDIRRRQWMSMGHIMRKGQDNDYGVALTWAHEGKRKRGRHKTTWRRTAETERPRAGWRSRNEVRATANDRNSWFSCVEA